MNNDFNVIFDYVKTSPWKDDTDNKTVIKQAYLAFNDITKNKTKEKLLYRLCGQTGSGKTTQLLESMNNYHKIINKNPIVIGVRTCSKYHPKYEEYLSKYGKDSIRELTNGFALKCMTYLLKLLIENGYLILLDITLLDPIYEKYVLDLLNKNNYKVKYHIMSVSNDISNMFLNKRLKDTGRIVYSSSSNYFNYIFDIGLKFLIENDTNNSCYIWSIFNKDPVYIGPIKNCYKIFNIYRNMNKELIYNEDELRQAKLNFLLNLKE